MKKIVLIFIGIVVILSLSFYQYIKGHEKSLSDENIKVVQYIYNKYGINAEFIKAENDRDLTGSFGNDIQNRNIISLKYNDNEFYVISEKENEEYTYYDNYQFEEIRKDLMKELKEELKKEIEDIDLILEEPYIGLNGSGIVKYNGCISKYYNKNEINNIFDFISQNNNKISIVLYTVNDNLIDSDYLERIKLKTETFISLDFEDVNLYNEYKSKKSKGIIFSMYSNSSIGYEEFLKKNYPQLKNYYIKTKSGDIISTF